MIYLESIRMAVSRLFANKARSLLTMLGVIVGTGAVVALLSIGRGASGDVSNRIQGLGTNLLTVNAGSSFTGGVRGAGGSATSLTPQDATSIASTDGVAGVAPEATSQQLVVAGTSNSTTSIVGTTPAYLQVRSYKLQRGSFLPQIAQDQQLPMAVLGATTLTNLGLQAEDALNSTISIGGLPFRVIGVLQPKGGSGFQDPDDEVVIPLSTLQRHITGTDNVRSISLSTTSTAKPTDVTARLTLLLRSRHGLSSTAQDDFSITSQSQLLETFSSINKTLTYLLGGVAAISLIVAGIGIMNMMLMSVQERTFEIGIRKAVGARRRDIMVQFVTEAIGLSALGGLIGVVMGVATARATSAVAGWQTVVTGPSLLLAFSFSIVVGVVFGAIPAYKAAGLDPVRALRYQ